jgi:acetyl esterase
VNVEIASFGHEDASRERRRHPVQLRAARPDAEVRRLFMQLNLWPRGKNSISLSEARRHWQLVVKAFASREPVDTVAERAVAGANGPIRLRIYTPSGEGRRPVLVWFHGGGFVAGDLYTAGATCRALANRSGAIVVAVEYRLAPEHPLEVGRSDCLEATRWVAQNAEELGADPLRMAVGGDSAGGTQAAAVAQACAAGDGPALALQVLVYPATDLARDYESSGAVDEYLLGAADIAWMRSEIAKVSDITDPALSPIHGPYAPGLAPALVLTAGFDPLRDEALEYVDRLREHRVPVTSLHYPGQVHGFLSFDRISSGARDALRRIGSHVATVMEHEHEGAHGDVGVLGASLDLLRWMTPAQRWNESVVAAMFIGSRMRRGLARALAAGDISKR